MGSLDKEGVDLVPVPMQPSIANPLLGRHYSDRRPTNRARLLAKCHPLVRSHILMTEKTWLPTIQWGIIGTIHALQLPALPAIGTDYNRCWSNFRCIRERHYFGTR